MVRPQPSFMKKVDDFLWACLRAGLHLSVFFATAVVVFIFYIMKDKIVLKGPDDPDSRSEEAALPGEMLGNLPAAPVLTQPPVTPASTPITLPPPAQPAPAPPSQAPAPAPASPGSDAMAALMADYRAAVQNEATAALDKVRLNDLPFFQQELQRLQNGEPVPETDDINLPDALKRLRAYYRSRKAALGK